MSLEDPPSYSDIDEEICLPSILILDDLSVYAENAQSAPLYVLNRAVASITQATKQVQISRIERKVKTGGNEESTSKTRSRHIYDLKYAEKPPGGLEPMPSESPQAYIQAVSRQAVGSIGLKKKRFPSKTVALPIDLSGKTSKYASLPSFIKKARPFFQIQRKNSKFEWSDGDGNAVAVEDDIDGQNKLVVTASLRRDFLDALVALWCVRIWKDAAEHAERFDGGMEGGDLG
ncbi:hypothetical protein FKW77_008700 [Venturia effusa]|uniref:Uncharacterized protein n=1 Tax=Venturia effusa TaxID=50376 RepID=A0A517L9U2_9PEZI|nr:hypothetical protein FKW77_008700 [Venturia effusa]